MLICNYACLGQIKIKTGAENVSEYLNLINDKSVGIIANNGSIINSGSKNIHLVDSLILLGINVKKISLDISNFIKSKKGVSLILLPVLIIVSFYSFSDWVINNIYLMKTKLAQSMI